MATAKKKVIQRHPHRRLIITGFILIGIFLAISLYVLISPLLRPTNGELCRQQVKTDGAQARLTNSDPLYEAPVYCLLDPDKRAGE